MVMTGLHFPCPSCGQSVGLTGEKSSDGGLMIACPSGHAGVLRAALPTPSRPPEAAESRPHVNCHQREICDRLVATLAAMGVTAEWHYDTPEGHGAGWQVSMPAVVPPVVERVRGIRGYYGGGYVLRRDVLAALGVE